jgi:beta-glucanase (GH16 family)
VLTFYSFAVALVVVVTLAIVTRGPREAVLNRSAAENVSDWQAASASGRISISRAKISAGPEGVSTAVELRRADPGKWAFALAGLREPTSFFKVGFTYRLRAYVRDLNATNGSIGIMLANSNFEHRPSLEYAYGRYKDDSWHLLQRTFTVTTAADSDTELYFDLPTHGPLRWEITLASVRQVSLPAPRTVSGPPSTVLTFDGPKGAAPDPKVWRHEVGGNGWGNGELQTYTDASSNVSLDGSGSLQLTARREEAIGTDGIRRQYTSGRISTVGKFEVEPGSYVEGSIRAPVGVGMRAAFWLIGANFADAGWPQCGELDIMETTQRSPAMVYQTIHFPRTSNLSADAAYGESAPRGYTRLSSPRDARTHRYGVYFDKDVVQFYVDRQPRLTLSRQEAVERDRTWPFGQPQHLVLNIAITSPPPAAELPVEMKVSDISIWEGGVPAF